MSFLQGSNREQAQLLPPCLEDYVGPDSPVRFIDAYVDGLNLAQLGFQRTQPAATGRPPYNPSDLLKLYLYGYLNRVRSSRRLEAEATRNLELIWLLSNLRPDFKTIADFRKDNRAAFKPLFKHFNLLCRNLGLFGAELIAIDGCKFGAVNNCKRHFTQEQLGELIGKIEHRIDEYLGQLDQQDQQSEGCSKPTARQVQEKIALLKERKGSYEQLLGSLKENGQNEISLTDPDARVMKGVHGHSLAYNVQTAVDSKHHLIVAQDVTQQASDYQQLEPMAVAAKEQLPDSKLKVLADKGYHGCDQLAACEKAGLEPIVPAPRKNNNGAKIFAKAKFQYDATADVYHCPGGQSLSRYGPYKTHGYTVFQYENSQACFQCALLRQCTTGKHRIIVRSPNEAAMERSAARVAAQPALVAQRRIIVEHVFGTFRTWNHDRFLMRGLAKVQAEFSLSALAYNLRRVLNTVSIEKLLAAV